MMFRPHVISAVGSFENLQVAFYSDKENLWVDRDAVSYLHEQVHDVEKGQQRADMVEAQTLRQRDQQEVAGQQWAKAQDFARGAIETRFL